MVEKLDGKVLPTHFVGIGASAGGLESIKEMLHSMPHDLGIALIIVQHLSPDFKSMMQELLEKHTLMEIKNVTDGMLVEANKIYLIPPKKNMIISNGKLLLSDKNPDLGLNLPIDVFFRSLAEDQQHKAIGIVLSGTGSDGTRGVKALKEAGGLVIAQTPDSAKFDGMPFSAISSGVVDLKLPPDLMGEKLTNYINHPISSGEIAILHTNKTLLAEGNEVMAEIFDLLKERSNIDFTNYKPSTVARRIERRMAIHQFTALKDYLDFLKSKKEEANLLSQELLIGVTRFFRDYESFKVLREEVIPNIVANSTFTNPIRVWVCACSTGEEAYSIAILLQEELKKQNLKRTVKIFATDVNADSISVASAGVYLKEEINDVPKSYVTKYFHDSMNSSIKIDKFTRQMVVFARHDMYTDPPFSKVDLVTCRNALIYYQSKAQEKILRSLHFSLKKGGFLFLGSSETLSELSNHFKVINERARIFQKNSSIRLSHPQSDRRETLSDTVAQLQRNDFKAPPSSQNGSQIESNTLLNAANQTLISKYAPGCILINMQNQAVHVHGELEPFISRIKPGRLSLNITDMANPELNIPINSAIHRVRQDEEEVLYTGLSVERGEGEVKFNLRVCPAFHREDTTGYLWLIFETLDSDSEQDAKTIAYNASEQTKQRISDLELELSLNKEHLQVTVEELETTNEELQSANEELMSSNEELQSTNEELQSVNEELYTVNTEYQNKINELSDANKDLDTVLELSSIGIIFLDESMCIRRYTNAIRNYINLLETDIGRPIHHFTNNVNYDRLLLDIAKVFKTDEPIQSEVVLQDLTVLRVTINPHIYDDDLQTKGATITFSNVSKIRYMEKAMEIAYDKLKHNIQSVIENFSDVSHLKDVSVLILDDSLADLEVLKSKCEKIQGFNASVYLAETIEAAKNTIKRENIDVCIADFYLQDSNALSFIESLAESDTSIPVIVVTNDLTETLMPILISNGVIDIIGKNELTPALLERSIKFAIQRRVIDEHIGKHGEFDKSIDEN